MKKKTITFVVGLLMFVSLISVGFASWIISTSTEKEVEGSFTVEEVVDARLGIETAWVEAPVPVYGDDTQPTVITGYTYTENPGANNIYFGAPEEDSSSDNWLTNTNYEKENLDVYLKITFSNLKGSGYTLDGAITLDYKAKNNVEDNTETEVDETENPFNDAVKKNYVKFADTNVANIYLVSNTVTPEGQTKPETTWYLSTASSYDADKVLATVGEDHSATVYIKISFAWGTAFDGKNPYTYYNGLAASNENVDKAIEVLEELYTLNGQSFIITISGKTTAN